MVIVVRLRNFLPTLKLTPYRHDNLGPCEKGPGPLQSRLARISSQSWMWCAGVCGTHPPLRRPYSSDLGDDFVLKNTTFRAPAISQNVTKCCACHEKSHSNFSKYCACHAKWISWLIRVTYETSFTMRGASTVSLQPHQILRLPRNL